MAAPTDVLVTSSGSTTIHTLPAVGQATMALSLPVAIASDQSAVPVSVVANTGSIGASNWPTSQVSVTTTVGGTSLVAARGGRLGVLITNLGTTAVFLGNTGVTTSTGVLLPGVVGASKTVPFVGQIFGIVASGTQTVSVEEYY
jgi:cytoskeletal protein RodZ